MSVEVRRRRERAAFLATFVGAGGELLIDTDNNRVQVHDGVTPGGWPTARLVEPNHVVDDGVNGRFKTILAPTGAIQFYVGPTGAPDSSLVLAFSILPGGNVVYPGTPQFAGPLAPAFVADWKVVLENYLSGSVQVMFENFVNESESDPGRIAFYGAIARVGGTFESMVLSVLRLPTSAGGAGLGSGTSPTDVSKLAQLRLLAQKQTS